MTLKGYLPGVPCSRCALTVLATIWTNLELLLVVGVGKKPSNHSLFQWLFDPVTSPSFDPRTLGIQHAPATSPEAEMQGYGLRLLGKGRTSAAVE